MYEITTSVDSDGTEEVSFDLPAEPNRVGTINFGDLKVHVFLNEGTLTVSVDTADDIVVDRNGPVGVAVSLNEGDLYRN